MIAKKYLLILVILPIFLLSLTAINIPVKAQQEPYVKVYVSPTVIPFTTVGGRVTVDIFIDISGIPDDSVEGIVGWGMDIQVDPNVLSIDMDAREARVVGARSGYLLYDFADWVWYDYPTLLSGSADPTTGYWDEIAEIIMPIPPGGAGDPWSGWKLVTIQMTAKSADVPCLIDLINVEWLDANEVWHPVDEVIDGYYGAEIIPEFPLGLTLMMMIAPAIPIVYLWRRKRRWN